MAPRLLAASSASSSAFPVASSLSSLTTSSIPSTAQSKSTQHDLSAFPEDCTLPLLGPDNNPNYIRAPPRLPRNTHPANDGSSQSTLTLAKTRLRYYYTSACTFLDLVDDPLLKDWRGKQRLRLRAGSRRLGPILRHPAEPPEIGLIRSPSGDLSKDLKELYIDSPITYWPPAQDPENPNPSLDSIYELLNPPTHLGNVEGTADERSIVYITGGNNTPSAIIFISFDPAIKLMGIRNWGGTTRKGEGEGLHIDGRATRYVDVGEGDRVVSVERTQSNGKGKGKRTTRAAVPISGGQSVVEVGKRLEHGSVGVVHGWAWEERAMYQDIGLGYYFGL